MFANLLEKKNARPAISMKQRQEPLMQRYVRDPEAGWIVDSATTSSLNIATVQPIHGEVTTGVGMPATIAIGVHKAVGGNCDHPNPGELLSAALASCLDSTIRIIANRHGVPLKHLSVKVDAHVDVRGTLRVDQNVPVGFQSIDVAVDIDAGKLVSARQLGMLLKAAEHSCVVLQTLRGSPVVNLGCKQLES